MKKPFIKTRTILTYSIALILGLILQVSGYTANGQHQGVLWFVIGTAVILGFL